MIIARQSTAATSTNRKPTNGGPTGSEVRWTMMAPESRLILRKIGRAGPAEEHEQNQSSPLPEIRSGSLRAICGSQGVEVRCRL